MPEDSSQRTPRGEIRLLWGFIAAALAVITVVLAMAFFGGGL